MGCFQCVHLPKGCFQYAHLPRAVSSVRICRGLFPVRASALLSFVIRQSMLLASPIAPLRHCVHVHDKMLTQPAGGAAEPGLLGCVQGMPFA